VSRAIGGCVSGCGRHQFDSDHGQFLFADFCKSLFRNRGRREEALKVNLEVEEEYIRDALEV
jgi:hypothetical protein